MPKLDSLGQQARQREYYSRTAAEYDRLHHHQLDEHQFALAMMCSAIELFRFNSILDIGSGTGRALSFLQAKFPDARIVGIEPSTQLREIGYAKGIPEDMLVDGDAMNLAFSDREFDLVCEFATLHHIPSPAQAVDEMLRVSKSAVFLSDSNKFGQGSAPMRAFKTVVEKLGLWNALDWVRTGGKGYMESEGDGLFYSYSLYDNYREIERACASVHIFNTLGKGTNPKRQAPQVAMLGLKEALIGSS